MATRSGHKSSPCVSISHHSAWQGDQYRPHAAFTCNACTSARAAHMKQSWIPETHMCIALEKKGTVFRIMSYINRIIICTLLCLETVMYQETSNASLTTPQALKEELQGEKDKWRGQKRNKENVGAKGWVEKREEAWGEAVAAVDRQLDLLDLLVNRPSTLTQIVHTSASTLTPEALSQSDEMGKVVNAAQWCVSRLVQTERAPSFQACNMPRRAEKREGGRETKQQGHKLGQYARFINRAEPSKEAKLAPMCGLEGFVGVCKHAHIHMQTEAPKTRNNLIYCGIYTSAYE